MVRLSFLRPQHRLRPLDARLLPRYSLALYRLLGDNGDVAKKRKTKKRSAAGMSAQSTRRTGSGAATTTGTVFQEDVALWLAVQILAEKDAPENFELGNGVVAEELLAETFDPIDDLQVVTSAGGSVLLQCKSTLGLSTKDDSVLAHVVSQFVCQLVRGVPQSSGSNRAVTATTDRFVLAVGPTSAATLREDLRHAVNAIRANVGSNTGPTTRKNQSAKYRTALDCLEKHFSNAWKAETGARPTQAHWTQFIRLFRIVTVDMNGGSDRRESEILLKSVLADRTAASTALDRLTTVVRTFSPSRKGGDRQYFRGELLRGNLSLRGIASFEQDIQALQRYSRERLGALSQHAAIRFRGSDIKLTRSVVDELGAMAGQGDLVVIGEPGAGKTGCVHRFASAVFRNGDGCVVLEAESLDFTSPQTLAASLGVSTGKRVADVLAAWPTTPNAVGTAEPLYLVVDALDAARRSTNLAALCDLLAQIRRVAPHWRVVASIREFDLRFSDRVQRLFPGAPHPTLSTKEFSDVRHLQVPRLSSTELDDAIRQCPPLAPLISNSGDLRDLASSPFNLRLLIGLLEHNLTANDFAAIRLQGDLLDLYWRERVTKEDPHRSLRNTTEALVRRMVQDRSLVTDRDTVQQLAGVTADSVHGLLQQGVIRSALSGQGAAQREQLSFAHNILFDYLAATLWVSGVTDAFIAELEQPGNHDLTLFARPSLGLAFEALWHASGQPVSDRSLFWQRALAVTTSTWPLIGKIIAPGIAAENFRVLSDVEHLLQQVGSNDSGVPAQLLRYFVAAAEMQFDDKNCNIPPFGNDAADWMSLAAAVAPRGGKLSWLAKLLLGHVEQDRSAQLTSSQAQAATPNTRALATAASPHQLLKARLSARTASFGALTAFWWSNQVVAAFRAVHAFAPKPVIWRS